MEKIKNLMTHRMAFLCLYLMLPLGIFAQSISVTGVVKDASGETVIGATVREKGTDNATVTDLNGNYTIRVAPKAALVFSYVGYKSAEVNVGGRTSVNVTLQEDNHTLNELVVIGYGTMKKSDLTGAVGSLAAKDMENAPVANIGQAMQGKIAGLQVVDAGKPGDNVSIKIRGLGSINNCDPLVVIDGVPTDLGLNAINTADVERIDVLKDASATAIYGSRGANGVVMVTTKKGKEGKGRLAFATNVSFQNATKTPSLLNAAEYAALSNDMMVNAGQQTNPDWASPAKLGKGTDWVDELLRTGYMQQYTLSYSGGSDKAHYYVSGGYLTQTGIVRSVDYRRFTFQENSDAQVLDWLKFSNNITVSADRKKQGSYDMGSTYRALPTFTVKDADGEWTGPEGNSLWYGSTRNPIGPTYVNSSKTNGYNLLANITAEISFTKWLKFKSTLGVDAKFWFVDNYTPAYKWKPTPVEESSRYKSDNKSFTYLWDNYFLFDHTFAQKHHVGLMAGTSAQWNNNDYLNAEKHIFAFQNVHEMDNGQKMHAIGGNEAEWSLMSYMARLNYDYDNKYLFTATMRRDGSSRFGRNHRWGTFPSMSVAWRISEEPWFKKTDVLSDLKLRAGYGVTGSQAGVSNYGYLASYNTSVYSFGYAGKEQAALVSATLANPNIHWEEVAQTNVGFDASLFGQRINLSLDTYIKDTRDMLVKASIPITSGFEDTSTTYTNAGKVRNTGFEFTLNTVNLRGPLGWETSVTYTYNKNKIKDLNSAVPYYINQINNSYVTMLANHFPINVFYGYVTDGVFQNAREVEQHASQPGAEPGDIRFKDLDNNGVINDNDRTVLGNPNPTHMFSMNNLLTWKGFELSIYLQGVAGNKIFNANKIDLTGMSAAYNQLTDVLGRWHGEGTSHTMPRAVYGDPNQNNRVSNRFVESGSYLRLKTITLAYNFPKQWLNALTIENARLTLSCENVATLTGYSGFDPEVGINGIDLSAYPISRTFNIGLNFNF
ncbi:MAG: TonB-dependent receptor [Prevotella buccae]|jgi:TonB-linked SusC/RagA family outer membrane protein|uniref:SusC/RagA family TonB-linked outer membrane protein n=1 Tax=Segatella buccae TaxID=28126 RepID=UPI0001C40BC2|nr:TonB-dependent receptor [Segatella buccae]EFC74990.1 TonB-linked outer membrane protein, SusC/RagA family [Segatella buccae D17]MBS5896024.1 TonB-dependent receptor [Segatella buccae]